MLLSVPHTSVTPTRPGLLGLTEQASLLLSEQAREHDWQGEGALSLKSFGQGQAHYRVDGRSYTLRPGQFLVLNRGQPYRVTIGGQTDTHSFCIFFGRRRMARPPRPSFGPARQSRPRPPVAGSFF